MTPLRFFSGLLRGEEAVTAAEYAVILGLIVMAIIVAIGNVGDTSSSLWNNNADQIGSALGGS